MFTGTEILMIENLYFITPATTTADDVSADVSGLD